MFAHLLLEPQSDDRMVFTNANIYPKIALNGRIPNKAVGAAVLRTFCRAMHSGRNHHLSRVKHFYRSGVNYSCRRITSPKWLLYESGCLN